MTDTLNFTHTVYCFNNKKLTKNFTDGGPAYDYAIRLLRLGHKCKIYPYRPPRRYVDILAERGPNG